MKQKKTDENIRCFSNCYFHKMIKTFLYSISYVPRLNLNTVATSAVAVLV